MNLLGEWNGQAGDAGLTWLNEPTDWSFADGTLVISPSKGTDFFRPAGGAESSNRRAANRL